MMKLKWRDKWLERKAIGITVQQSRRVFVTVSQDDFRKTMERLVKIRGFTQIATITGLDIGKEIEVIYHLKHKELVLSLRTRTSKKEPVIPTIVDLIPGSALYEREVHDLFGVTFIGNPDLSPLLLPEGWPDDVYPLRKKWTSEIIKHKLEGS